MDLKEINFSNFDITNHWYYVTKANALLSFTKLINCKSILDIGAGSRFFSEFLLNKTSLCEATCVDINYENEFSYSINGKNISCKKNIDVFSSDVILLMDVIEHVEDDFKFLSHYVSLASNNSYFIISVPAFQFLFSHHDVFLGHHRRYDIKQLNRLINSCGLKIISSSYLYFPIFPLVVFMRLFKKLFLRNQPHSDLKKTNRVINFLLIFILKIELLFFKHNKLAGLTIFCLAKKLPLKDA